MSQADLELVREQYTTTNVRDWERGLELWAEDIVLDVRVSGIRSGVVEGRNAVARWFAEWFSTFETDAHFELKELTELDDGSILAVSEHRARGRASGIEVTGEVVWRYLVEGGRIRRQIGHETREAALDAAAEGD